MPHSSTFLHANIPSYGGGLLFWYKCGADKFFLENDISIKGVVFGLVTKRIVYSPQFLLFHN